MSRTIRPHPLGMLAVAGFLGLAGLAAPALGHAQSISPGTALLNTVPIVASGRVTHTPPPAITVDGERGLLGNSTGRVRRQPTLASDAVRKARPVDGEQVLLGKVAPSGTRRLILAL